MKFLKRFLIALILIIATIFIIYKLGPKIPEPIFSHTLPEIPADIITLDNWVKQHESKYPTLKAGNEAKIVWNDGISISTEYAIVYLPGFGASHQEGFPVHTNLADSLNANLYLARLKGQGLNSENAYKGLTAESYMESAMEALSVGKLLGEKVIIAATSTGAAQALWLASEFPNDVEGLILYSPYIALRQAFNERLVLGPWGKNITKLVMGGEINHEVRPDSIAAFWSEYYHVDAYYSLFSMINKSMIQETFQKVQCPVFMAYYYKDESNQDNVVSVEAMKEMFAQLSSKIKKEIPFSESGNHVIASRLRSKDWIGVQDSSWHFIKNNIIN